MNFREEQAITRKLNEILTENILIAIAQVTTSVLNELENIKTSTELKSLLKDSSLNTLDLQTLDNATIKEFVRIWKKNIKELRLVGDFKPKFPIVPEISGFTIEPGQPITLPAPKMDLLSPDGKISAKLFKLEAGINIDIRVIW